MICPLQIIAPTSTEIVLEHPSIPLFQRTVPLTQVKRPSLVYQASPIRKKPELQQAEFTGVAALLQWKLNINHGQKINEKEQDEGGMKEKSRMTLSYNSGPQNLLKYLQQYPKPQGVLVHWDWDLWGGELTLQWFKNIKFSDVMDKGLLFVWSPKQYLPDIIEHLQAQRINYVENLQVTFFSKEALKKQAEKRRKNSLAAFFAKKTPQKELTDLDILNNLPQNLSSEGMILRQDSTYFKESKKILLIFRKHDAKDDFIELRHQRTSDSIFDLKDAGNDLRISIFRMIETLLPKACWQQDRPPRLLQLFGPISNETRKGWRHIRFTRDE